MEENYFNPDIYLANERLFVCFCLLLFVVVVFLSVFYTGNFRDNFVYFKENGIYEVFARLLPGIWATATHYTSLFDRSVRPGEHLVLGRLIWTQLQCMRFIPFKIHKPDHKKVSP